jgi:hypothetical protein
MREYSWGNVTLVGLTKLLYEIIFNCRTISLPNFYMEMFGGDYPRAFFLAFCLLGNNFHGRGHFWCDRETDYRLKSYSNDKC